MMKLRLRWEGKVRVAEYRHWFIWRESHRDDFTNFESGYPTYPPMDLCRADMFGIFFLEFPWVRGERVP